MDDFRYPIVLLIFPYLTGWLVGKLWASKTGEIVWLPRKNLMMTAAMVLIGTLTYNIAILFTSYPVVIMFKSCSILSAIIVGVCFSRVRDEKLKLGTNKLIVGGLVSVGIFFFNYYSMEDKGEKGTSLLGLILLLVSLIADGLLPDFQAEMKSLYKPRPVDLMFQINKWVFVFSIVYSLVTFDFWYISEFIWDHPTVLYDILGISCMNFFVQMFVYYIIQKFKQHVAPFVITIRKIFSVVISIFWFSHAIDAMQWFGVAVVFSAAIFDFISEKFCKKHPAPTPQEIQPIRMVDDSNNIPLPSSPEIITSGMSQ